MRYFFIDLENVRSAGLEGVLSLSEDDTVFIFYSDNAYNLSIPTLQSISSSKADVQYIKTNYIGSNAMDFQIVSLLGAMIERTRQGAFYIISHDNGFKSALRFCESYFESYDIKLGEYENIISALTGECRSAAGKKSESAASGKKTSGRKNSDNKNYDNKNYDNKNSNGKNSDDKNSNNRNSDNNDSDYSYIYRILKDTLSEKTIDIYASRIHEAICASSNKDELHNYFVKANGSDEGEALFHITRDSFSELKNAKK